MHLEGARTPEHPLCERCLRREIAAAIAEGRAQTRRLKAQGLPDEAIMRVERVWLERVIADKALGKRVREARERARTEG